VKRTAPIRVVPFCFFLFAVCGAWCQKPPSTELLRGLQFDGLNSSEVQHQEVRTWKSSFPDAPSSMLPAPQELRLHEFVGAIGVNADAMRATEPGQITRGHQPGLPSPYQKVFIQEESSPFLTKYLYSPLLEREARYHASTSDSLMGRATFAASRVFVTHDSSGKGRLNTRYFLGVLASVVLHSANRPNRMQSTSATFNNFGSTVGSDAGMNVFHEFGPGIQQIVKAHTPKFVSRIEERFSRNNADEK
jgi:hypothetical protein